MTEEQREKLNDAMREFALRALHGECNPQETEILPSVLHLLLVARKDY